LANPPVESVFKIDPVMSVRAKFLARTPPKKVLVAVVEVATKYGAPILLQDSIPPAKVDVAGDLIQIGMVVVGVRALTPKVFDDCCQS